MKKLFNSTVGPCLLRIWIVRILKNTSDLHSVYYGFLAFSDPLYYSGTCVVWFCIVRTFFGYLGRTMQGPYIGAFIDAMELS